MLGEHIYVADDFNHRIQKLRLSDGAPLASIGKGAAGDAHAACHWELAGLCVADGLVFVTDRSNQRVVVLGDDLTWRYAFGRKGSGDGEFNHPTTVAAHGGEVFVVDHCNHRVQVFAPGEHGRLAFARAIGSYGEAAGQFDRPWGVAVVRGLLLVSERRRLQVLSLHGMPQQVLTFPSGCARPEAGLCAHEERVRVTRPNTIDTGNRKQVLD
jgi:tripartite motif-containing protein 2/3/tripartite motif-containing protein 71